MVIADTIEEALQFAVKSGHLQKANNYRKLHDCTDDLLGDEKYPNLQIVLESGVSGPAEISDDGVWTVDGKTLNL